jgi:hypothetical protein
VQRFRISAGIVEDELLAKADGIDALFVMTCMENPLHWKTMLIPRL